MRRSSSADGLHALQGNAELAAKYAEQVRRYRQRNPYFHYAIAQAEYENARYQEALEAINTALDLKFRSGRFHFLKGLAETKLGALEEAQESFRRATRFGNYRDLKRRYLQEITDDTSQVHGAAVPDDMLKHFKV